MNIRSVRAHSPKARRYWFATVVLAACSGVTQPSQSVTAASYSLVSIDGKGLPLPEESDSTSMIISGTLTLIGNDSSRVLQTVISPGPHPITSYQLGYYSVQRTGDTLVMQPHYLASSVDTATIASGQVNVRAHVRTATGLLVESRIYAAP